MCKCFKRTTKQILEVVWLHIKSDMSVHANSPRVVRIDVSVGVENAEEFARFCRALRICFINLQRQEGKKERLEGNNSKNGSLNWTQTYRHIPTDKFDALKANVQLVHWVFWANKHKQSSSCLWREAKICLFCLNAPDVGSCSHQKSSAQNMTPDEC